MRLSLPNLSVTCYGPQPPLSVGCKMPHMFFHPESSVSAACIPEGYGFQTPYLISNPLRKLNDVLTGKYFHKTTLMQIELTGQVLPDRYQVLGVQF